MTAFAWQIAGSTLYLFLVVTIAVRAYKATHTSADFILGDRKLPYVIAALSAGASDMSGWLLLGLPGLAMVSASESIWTAIGLTIGVYANWRFIAKPLRIATEAHANALSLPEFFANRFGDRRHALRRLAASFTLLFFSIYTAAGFVAGGKLFATAFALDYNNAVVLCAGIVLAYTAIGGFLAVSWSDALQAGLMLAALVIVAVLATMPHRGPVAPVDWRSLFDVPVLAGISALAWGLGYVGQPHILSRFMAIEDHRAVGAARRIAILWTIVGLIAAITIGLAGSAFIAASGGALADQETIFIVLSQALLHPAIAGLCLAGILAAIMSTADSQLLVAATALTHDLVRSNTRHALQIHRLAVTAISIIACVIALQPDVGVLQLVAYAWAGFGATFGPCVVLSLYFPKTTLRSAISAMLAGAVTVIIWPTLDGPMFELYALAPGFCVGLASGLLAHYVSSPDG